MALAKRIFFVVSAVLIHTTDGDAVKDLHIIGGNEITINDAPYMVSLFYNKRFLCGGSIVDANFILTAAHCTIYKQSFEIDVLIGSDRLNDGGLFVSIEGILEHPEYDNNTKVNDIALLKLQQPIHDCYLKAVPIGLPNDDRQILEGTMANVTGWGYVGNNMRFVSNKLRLTSLPLISYSCCSQFYPDITHDKICAGSQGHDTCQGDSGGPLTYNGVQIGVVSAGKECGRYPGVYTRVSYYLYWITTTIQKYQ